MGFGRGGLVANGQRGVVLRLVQSLFTEGTAVGFTDDQLLNRFVANNGETAERAFAVLIERHGPMVLRTCRAVLRDSHDAHDAFQATFLVLARKARGLQVRDSLAPWLYRVAYRTACCARSARGRRQRLERWAAEHASTREVVNEFWDDSALVLHEEVSRLPEKYRSPVVLCYFEGLTHDQAAHRLNWPVGTVRSRLARGRERLRVRLVRRGIAPTVAVLSALDAVSAEVPFALMNSSARAAVSFATCRVLAVGSLSATTIVLTERMMTTMFLTKLKLAGMFLLTTSVVATGAGVFARQAVSDPGAPTPAQSSQSARNDDEAPTKPVARTPTPADGSRGAGVVPVFAVPIFRARTQVPAVESQDDVELAKARCDIKAAELRAADTRVQAAKTKRDYVELLSKKKVVSKQELEEANAELNNHEADRDVAKAALREAEVQLKQAERRRNQPGPQAAQPGSEEADEVKLAKIRLKFKEADLRGATARLDAALAELDRLTMLNKRGAGFVNATEIAKVKATVEDRVAERDHVRAEIEEAELFVADAERLAAHPESRTMNSLRVNAIDPDVLDRRLKAIELKLDQILKALEDGDQAH